MNYFNYFTEVEDHFRRARNSGMFMMSPLDWVLVESWKDAGIPLDAVLKGIDRSFEKFHSRKRRTSTVNSVAYCSQEVIGAAREMAQGGAPIQQSAMPGLEPEDLAAHFRGRAEELRQAIGAERVLAEHCAKVPDALEELGSQAAAGGLTDLEDAERRVTVLEDRLLAAAIILLSDEQRLEIERDLDAQLSRLSRTVSAEHIAMARRNYIRRRTFETAGLPRLSVYFMSQA